MSEHIDAAVYEAKTPKTESAFIIERWYNSQQEYWDGKFIDRRGWESSIDNAVRFARREDAASVLAWLLEGGGRVAEHVWISDTRVKP